MADEENELKYGEQPTVKQHNQKETSSWWYVGLVVTVVFILWIHF